MDIKRLSAGLLLFVTLAWAGVGAAPGEWLVGVQTGLSRHTFHSMYTYPAPDTDFFKYDNDANGLDLGFYGEYRLSLAGFLKLGARARLSWQRADWTLHYVDEEETSDLRFRIPFSYAFSLVPRVKIPGGPELFVELGLGQSRVKQTRASANFATFDYSGLPFNEVLGAGLGFKVLPRVELDLLVRKTYFSRFTYRSFWPNGAPYETITDRPSSLFVGAGLTFRLK